MYIFYYVCLPIGLLLGIIFSFFKVQTRSFLYKAMLPFLIISGLYTIYFFKVEIHKGGHAFDIDIAGLFVVLGFGVLICTYLAMFLIVFIRAFGK